MQKELNKSGIYAKNIEQSTSIRLIIIKGAIDYTSTPTLSSFLEPIVEKMKEPILIIDIGGVQYMSSTAMGLFVRTLKTCKTKNIDLYLMNIHNKVLDVFQLLGFSNFFHFITSFDEVKQKAELIENVFPFVGKCEICEKKFKVIKPGKFRCPGCRGIFKVDDNGEVWFF